MPSVSHERMVQLKISNNSVNPGQNVCAHAVAYYLNVDHRVQFLHNIDDIKRAVSFEYSLRSVKTKVGWTRRMRVVDLQRKIRDRFTQDPFYYLVWVNGHILLVDCVGETVVDTAPQRFDDRYVRGVWGLFMKKGVATFTRKIR